MKTLFIGMPVYKDVEPETEATLNDIAYMPSDLFKVVERGVFKIRGSPNVYTAGEKLAQEFIKSGADYFLFFGSDHSLDTPRKAIELLIRDDKDIISPLVVRKSFPHIPTCLSFRDRDLLDTGKVPERLEDFRSYPKPFEVYYSCGVCLIKREVILEVFREFDTCFWPVIGARGLLSNDYSFMHRAKALLFSCWVEPRIKITHIGRYAFTLDDYYGLVDSGEVKFSKVSDKIYRCELERVNAKG